MFSKLWVPHEKKVFELVELVSENVETGELIVLSLDDNTERKVLKSDSRVADETHLQDFDDLCYMNNLHEAPLLNMLHRRFLGNKIYTNTGNILISINPYRVIPGLYDDPIQFLDLYNEDCPDDLALPQRPHVNVIANQALRTMITESDEEGDSNRLAMKARKSDLFNQSIIVSGESGAGKTEASKLVMTFLIAADHHLRAIGAKGSSAATEVGDHIKTVLLDSSVVLEAVGNSKTVRNDNSSRFGKYIKLQYTSDNQLLSAYTETFLLEKSRLVAVGAGERNYHVFYEVIRGLNIHESSLASRLMLSSVDSFDILTQGGCTVIGSEDNDVENFLRMRSALASLACSPQQALAIWEILAVVLHLGNVTVQAAEVENNPAGLVSREMSLDGIASLLQVDLDQFVASITTHRMQAGKRGSIHIKVLSATDAKNNISALMKWLYRAVFSWLVSKINLAHGTAQQSCGRSVVKFIGILDIFGFEILGCNSFEQLCINYTNERLQQQFNEHVFVLEQLEYAKEDLQWNSISFRDNQHVIDLISKRPQGLLVILEEHGMMNRKPDDSALLTSFVQAHDKSNIAFAKSRFANETFVVKHFAGDVVYSIDGFLNKNNNSMQEDLQELMSCCNNSFLLDAMQGLSNFQTAIEEQLAASRAAPKRASESGSGASANKKMASADTVSFQFRNQLDLLIGTLRSTNPHYIKCVKPNPRKKADDFDAALVLEQLRYSGALEVVRIRREGYPTRISFSTFYEECAVLARGRGWAKPGDCDVEAARLYSIALANEYLDAGRFQAGRSMLFLTDGCIFTVHNAILAVHNAKATFIQNCFRRHSTLCKYNGLKRAVPKVQRYIRKFIRRMRSLKELRARWARREREAEELRQRLEQERLEREARERQEAAELKARLEREEAERQAREQLELEARMERLMREEAEARRLEAERLRQLEQEARKLREQQEAEAALMKLELEKRLEEERVLAAAAEAALLQERRRQAQIRILQSMNSFIRRKRLQKRVFSIMSACANNDDSSLVLLLQACPADSLLLVRVDDTSPSPPQHLFQVLHKSGCELAISVAASWIYHHAPAYFQDFLLAGLQASKISSLLALGGAVDCLAKPQLADSTTQAEAIKVKSVAILKAVSEGNGVLLSGSLEKRRGKNEWKSRWCAVNESEILYYVHPTDTIPKGVVPLKDCTIQKFPQTEHTFEIFAPNIANKKSFFGAAKVKAMLFRAQNEVEYHQWIAVLRAVTGSIAQSTYRTVSRHLRSEVFSSLKESVIAPAVSQGTEELDVSRWLAVNSAFHVECYKDLVMLPGYSYLRLFVFKHSCDAASASPEAASLSSQNIDVSLLDEHGLAVSLPKLLSIPVSSSSHPVGLDQVLVVFGVPLENINEPCVSFRLIGGDTDASAPVPASAPAPAPAPVTMALASKTAHIATVHLTDETYKLTLHVLVEYIKFEDE